MKDRILVPLNDSAPARAAFEEALELFGDRELIALHVPEFTDVSRGADGAAVEALGEDRDETATALFEEAQQAVEGSEATLERVVQPGDPDDVIVSYAVEHDVDHIVMGSHGRSGLRRMMLGSVAESVTRNAPVSVTIARPDAVDAAGAGDDGDEGDAGDGA